MTFPDRLLTTLSSHKGPVHCLSFSSGTGQYLLTGSSDRTIHLSNPAKPASSALIQSYSAHGHEILDLALTPDNARFASVGGDKQVFLWDVSTARTLRRWSGHFGRVNCVDFGGEDYSSSSSSGSSSGSGWTGGGGQQQQTPTLQPNIVVSGSFDATVRIWDCRSQSPKAVQVLEEAKDSVQSIAVVTSVSGGGGAAEILAGSVDGFVRCYDIRMGNIISDYISPSPVTSLSVTKDGEAYAVSTLDSKIRLMDRGNGKLLREFTAHKNTEFRVRSCLGMADALLLSGSEDGYIYAWDVLSGDIKAKVQAHNGKVVNAVAWNGFKKEWASAGTDGMVCVWGLPLRS